MRFNMAGERHNESSSNGGIVSAGEILSINSMHMELRGE